MFANILEYVLILALVILLAVPAGKYIRKVMQGEKVWISPLIRPVESWIYKGLHIEPTHTMGWKTYGLCVLALSLFSFVWLWMLLMCQGFLPGNPMHVPGMSWDLAFNTAASFITNTNWQAYAAEGQISYLSQMAGLTVQNFVSAAIGMSVLFALIRGFLLVHKKGIGNFWVDMTRSLLYVLLPFSLVLSLLLVGGGVIQNFSGPQSVPMLEPVAVDAEGQVLEDAAINMENQEVRVDGQIVPDARIVTEQYIPMGPAASQIAIKQIGTNGGGFMATNSSHPLENPTAWTNLLEMVSILLIPASLVFAFGGLIKNKKQGLAIFAAMLVCLCVGLAVMGSAEQQAPYAQPALDTSMVQQAGGNMEGKESRFGIVSSTAWSTLTTATSSGSVNSSMEAYTPTGTLSAMLLMQIGEVVFGGIGCGLYSMIGFIMLTVFIAGLMVGRTPEFLGKKIEPYEMKWTVILCMSSAFAILLGSAIACLLPGTLSAATGEGAHGFTQLLYGFTSAGANNGSSMNGLIANSAVLNTMLAIAMLFARYVPMMAVLAIAGHMAAKKKIAVSAGTMSTDNGLFVFLLIFIILLVGALSFFPALSLGPIAEMLH